MRRKGQMVADEERVYAAARSVLEEGLMSGGSVFTPGTPVWTRANADDLVGRITRPQAGATGTFLERLVAELADASPGVTQLAAELLYLHYLPASDIAGSTKRLGLRTVLDLLGRRVAVPANLDAALDDGVMKVGVAFKTYRAAQIAWLAQVVAHVKAQRPEEVQAALADPWEFRTLVDAVPTTTAAGQRRALLHLAFPHVFIASLRADHLTSIVQTYQDRIGGLTGDGERDFAAIRASLEEEAHGPVDFFVPPWSHEWGWDKTAPATPTRKGWLVRGANVNGRNLVPEWLRDGYCSIAFPEYPLLEPGLSKTTLTRIVREAEPGLSPAVEGSRVYLLDRFLNRIAVGDVVVTVNDARVYIGVISSDVYWVEAADENARRRRNVHWIIPDTQLLRRDLSPAAQDRLSGQLAVLELGETTVEFVELVDLDTDQTLTDAGSVSDSLVVVVEPLGDLPPATEELAERLLVDQAWLDETIDLLNEKKQLVLYGPPGTGKTFLAQAIAEYVTTETNGAHRLVQFHPSYAYEDFVEGFRPSLTSGDEGSFRFSKEQGPLLLLAASAKDGPGGAYVLIVDEINRANLPKVFGELYFLLEYRERALALQYSPDGDFRLPQNLFVIGTMNTADRSIALVDAAMRRRFAWQGLFPGAAPVDGMLRRWLARHDLPPDRADLLDALNTMIGDRDAAIGPSYLMNPRVATEAGLERIWRTQILPLLEERHLGEHEDVAGYVLNTFGLAALRSQLGAAASPEGGTPGG
jgi:5-methylcytosine-specific restriction enzyme B